MHSPYLAQWTDSTFLHLMTKVVEQMRDAVLITQAEPIDSPGPRIIYANPAFYVETGFSPQEIIGQTPRILQGPGTRRATLDIIRQHLSRWEGVRVEVLNYRKNGQEFWVELDIMPLVDPTSPRDVVTHWISVQKNIDAHVKTAQELRRANEQYRLLADHGHDVIAIHDPAGTLLYVSESIERLANYRPEQLLGQTSLSLVHPDDRAAYLAIRERMQTPGPSQTLEWRFCRKDGKYLWLRSNFVGDYDQQGRLIRIICGSRNQTTQKAIEEQLRQSQKLQAISQLASGISHDFNNLLTVVVGCAELLEEAIGPGSPLMPLVHDIKQAGERGSSLTKKMLAFSRHQPMHVQIFDLNQLMSESCRIVQRLLGEKIKLRENYLAEAMFVRGDTIQFEQVILNLLVNARDAMPQGGELRIETSVVQVPPEQLPKEQDITAGEYCRLRVEDTGQGMTAEVQEHLFEPFFTTKPIGQGTGLGLATVYGIVRALQGFLRVNSEVGVGTVFEVYLPRVGTEETQLIVDQQSGRMPKPRQEVILLVGDDPAVRQLIRSVLEELGYQVESAEDSRKAMKLYQELPRPPDLVITDIMMPHMNGYELAGQIHKHKPAQRILFITGYSADPNLDITPTSILTKPFTTEQLITAIETLLQSEDSVGSPGRPS